MGFAWMCLPQPCRVTAVQLYTTVMRFGVPWHPGLLRLVPMNVCVLILAPICGQYRHNQGSQKTYS